MEQKNLLTIELNKTDSSDIQSFCDLNEITDIEGFSLLCLRKGFYIEKYGLLNQGQLPDVIDREFEKEVVVEDNSKIEELQNEIYILKGKLENQKEVECGKLFFIELENLTKTSYAFYLKSSNLKDRL
jgi:hypothetical protein